MNETENEALISAAFRVSVLQFVSVGISYFPVIGARWRSCWALWLVCVRNHHVAAVLCCISIIDHQSFQLSRCKWPPALINDTLHVFISTQCLLLYWENALNKLSWFMNAEFWLGITDLHWSCLILIVYARCKPTIIKTWRNMKSKYTTGLLLDSWLVYI